MKGYPHLPIVLCFTATLAVLPPSTATLWAAPAVTTPVQKAATTLVPVSGQILGPDDKPVIGAEIGVITYKPPYTNETHVIKTDEKGRFSTQLEVENSVLEELEQTNPKPDNYVLRRVIITAPKFAITAELIKKGENVFRMEKARSVSGTVVNEAGKPKAGVTVGLTSIRWNEDLYRFIGLEENNPLRSKFITRSDADGRWTIEGLPQSGMATFKLLDSTYAQPSKGVDLESPTSVAKPLIAKVGARITGRVLVGDNKPLAGVEVRVQGSVEGVGSYGQATTDTEGRYLISGLDEGVFSVTASEKSGEWIGQKLTDIKTKTGETNKVQDFVLGHGFFIEGTVLDQEIGLPIENATVAAQSTYGYTVSTPTDTKGRYRVRVLSGDIRFYVYSTPRGYLRHSSNGMTVDVKEDTKTVGPIRLKKGLTIAGTAVDEAGQPVTGVKLSVGNPFDGATAYADSEGNWKMFGVEAEYGRRNQPVGSLELTVAGDWKIVEPKKVSVPVTGPIKVVLRPMPLATLSGRVLTTDGKPIEGASVMVDITQGNTTFFRSKTSDADGRFSITKLRPENKFTVKSVKEGYKFLSGGKVTRNNDELAVQDIVLASLSNSITGRVLTANGSVAIGYPVVAIGVDPIKTVETGPEQTFTIDSLPEGKVRLMAAFGYEVGELEVDTKNHTGNVEIKLAERTPSLTLGPAAAVKLIESLSDSADKDERESAPKLAKLLASNDVNTVLSLCTKSDGTIPDDVLYTIINVLIQNDPERAAKWVPDQLKKINDTETRLTAAYNFGIATAEVDPEPAKAVLKQLAASLKPNDLSESATFVYCKMAALAKRLNQTDKALSYVDYAVVALEKSLGKKKANERMEVYAEVVADGGADLVRSMIADMSPADKIRALERAIPPLARHNVAEAQTLLKEMATTMENLQREGGLPQEEQNDGMYRPTPDQSYAAAVYSVIKELKVTDPATSLALARSTKKTPYLTYDKPSLLMMAASVQKPDVALQVLIEAMKLSMSGETENTEISARIAAMTHDFDTQKSEEFFAHVKQKIKGRTTQSEDERIRPSFSSYAFYHSFLNPAESRLLIEAEWARRRANSPDDYVGAQARGQLALAMTSIDLGRALEMAHSIPNTYNERTDLYKKIIHYLLVPANQRQAMPFGEIGASDDY